MPTATDPANKIEDVDISLVDHAATGAAASRALWVGGAGDVKVTTDGGSTVTIQGVQAGTLLPVRVTTVFKTGTTATLMQLWW